MAIRALIRKAMQETYCSHSHSQSRERVQQEGRKCKPKHGSSRLWGLHFASKTVRKNLWCLSHLLYGVLIQQPRVTQFSFSDFQSCRKETGLNRAGWWKGFGARTTHRCISTSRATEQLPSSSNCPRNHFHSTQDLKHTQGNDFKSILKSG